MTNNENNKAYIVDNGEGFLAFEVGADAKFIETAIIKAMDAIELLDNGLSSTHKHAVGA